MSAEKSLKKNAKKSRQWEGWRGFISEMYSLIQNTLSFRTKLLFVIYALLIFILFLPYLFAEFSYQDQKLFPHKVDATVETFEIRESNMLWIERLQISAPIQYVTEKNEEVYQIALQNGVVHYPGTAGAGEFGNMYIFGHSSDFLLNPGDYKTIFATLPHLEIGDEIIVSDMHGVAFHYRVTETKVVGPNDISVLDQGDGTKKLLTVQTSYPLGTALKRYIVVSELIDN